MRRTRTRSESTPSQAVLAHAIAPDEAVAALRTDARPGLAGGEAARRHAATGANRIATAHRTTHARILLRTFRDPLVLLLLTAAAVAAGIGAYLLGRQLAYGSAQTMGDAAVALVCLGLLAATLYAPPLHAPFGPVPLRLVEIAACLGFALVPVIPVEAGKGLRWRCSR